MFNKISSANIWQPKTHCKTCWRVTVKERQIQFYLYTYEYIVLWWSSDKIMITSTLHGCASVKYQIFDKAKHTEKHEWRVIVYNLTTKSLHKDTNPARGIPDFCKQKLLAPVLEPSSHLAHYNHTSALPLLRGSSQWR